MAAKKKIVIKKVEEKKVAPKLTALESALLKEERLNYSNADKVKFSNNLGNFGVFHTKTNSFLCYSSEMYIFIKKFENTIAKKEGVYDIVTKKWKAGFGHYTLDRALLKPDRVVGKFGYEMNKSILKYTDTFIRYNRDDDRKSPLAFLCFDFSNKKVYPTFADELKYSNSKSYTIVSPKLLRTAHSLIPDFDTVLFNQQDNVVIFKKGNKLVFIAGSYDDGKE